MRRDRPTPRSRRGFGGVPTTWARRSMSRRNGKTRRCSRLTSKTTTPPPRARPSAANSNQQTDNGGSNDHQQDTSQRPRRPEQNDNRDGAEAGPVPAPG